MQAPSMAKQNGSRGTGRVSTGVRVGGRNQGKVSGTGRRYSAHPLKRGQ